MGYLAKLKEKLKAEQARGPFVSFVRPQGEHVSTIEVQPVVYKDPKITNTSVTDKTDKRVRFSSASELSQAQLKMPTLPAQLEAVTTVGDSRAGLAKFRKTRLRDFSCLRHDQASWAAEMFLQEWGAMAAEFGWMPDDIFDRDGLAYWLEAEIVTALGPEYAVTESGRAYDRVARATWVNPSRTLQ